MTTMTPYLRRRVRETTAQLEALRPGYSRRVRGGLLVTRGLDQDVDLYVVQSGPVDVRRGTLAEVAEYIHGVRR